MDRSGKYIYFWDTAEITSFGVTVKSRSAEVKCLCSTYLPMNNILAVKASNLISFVNSVQANGIELFTYRMLCLVFMRNSS